jgi:lysophospholipase L1-like esterase
LNVTPDRSDRGCTLGVLAFGDSITNGGGELQWGVALQSWALWVARATGLPFTGYAVDGARVADVVAEQIPAFERDDRARGARYDVGCLYIGVNDVRAVDWDREAFERDFDTAIGYLTERADRTLALTAPRDLGRPRAGPKVAELNETIEHTATAAGALVVDLSDFGARNHVMVDHVHPTAFGQIAIAERALMVLEADGLPATVAPSTMISYDVTRWQRLRADVTYVYRHAKASARAMAIRLRAGRLPRSPRAGAAPPEQ